MLKINLNFRFPYHMARKNEIESMRFEIWIYFYAFRNTISGNLTFLCDNGKRKHFRENTGANRILLKKSGSNNDTNNVTFS